MSDTTMMIVIELAIYGGDTCVAYANLRGKVDDKLVVKIRNRMHRRGWWIARELYLERGRPEAMEFLRKEGVIS